MFFDVFYRNELNGQFSTRVSCLLMFMTGLPVGSISGLKSEEVYLVEGLWMAPHPA